MIKALFFDIDGTLVPFGAHSIPDEVNDALAQLRAKGVKVFIATGRHMAWIDNLGDTEFDGYITVNGGICLAADRHTPIYSHCIDDADMKRLIAFDGAKQLPLVVVPEKGGIFITHTNEEVDRIGRLLKIPPIDVRPLSEAAGKRVAQLMVFGTEEERDRSGIFKEALLGCSPTSWHPAFCDVIPRGSDKSVGIDRIIEHFGISLDETMAFGDGGNDIGMIRHAGIGVAMGNATDEVKLAADYVTTAVNDHGVVNALRHFGLL